MYCCCFGGRAEGAQAAPVEPLSKAQQKVVTAIKMAMYAIVTLSLGYAFQGVSTLPYEITQGMEMIPAFAGILLKYLAVGFAATVPLILLKAAWDYSRFNLE